jgi:serine/threonine-protein kinase
MDKPLPTGNPAPADRPDRAQSTVILTDRFSERRAAPSSQNFDHLEAGTKLGRYLIINQIGGGGMGHVYRAQDTELNRPVALKVLPPHLCKHPEYLQRFRTEAQAQARLLSPYIITLYSLMELPAGEVLVMEYAEGQTLANRLRAQGPLPMDAAVRILEQVLRGVEHMHRMGVVHRDLKPSNIFLTHDGEVKIMDFGVARLMEQHDPGQGGAMVGTLLYISPEQINGRETDFRSDVYTLGVTLFETVTGRLPFERRSDYALMHAHVQEEPPHPHVYQRRIPPALEWVILKAIEKDPGRRFQSAAEFRAALLKLGVLERRQRDPEKQPLGHLLPDRGALKQEFWRYHLADRRRLLGGIGFDLVLVGLAGVLAFSLGLLPLTKSTPEEPAPASIAPKPTVNVAPPKPARPAPPPVVATKPAPVPRPAPAPQPKAAPQQRPAAPAPAPVDHFEAARRAWGE